MNNAYSCHAYIGISSLLRELSKTFTTIHFQDTRDVETRSIQRMTNFDVGEGLGPTSTDCTRLC